jgi:hypothetical protein
VRARWASTAPVAAALLAMVPPLVSAGLASASGPRAGVARTSIALRVIPFPGTPDASPQSQIIFSALRPSDLAGPPVVTGSASGAHSGRLVRLPDHAGTAFVPAQAFAGGERVRVRALLTSSRAGTASGDPGSTSLDYSFTVASPPPASSTATATATTAGGHAQASSGGHLVFRSEPHLKPPPVHVSGRAPGAREIFVSPRDHVLFEPAPPSSAQSGPMILSPRGRLLWFHPLPGQMVAFNLEEQRYRGQPVLTWWQGGAGYGSEDVVMSSSYQPIAVLKGGWGYGPDLHEFQITPQGTALMDAVVSVKANLTSIGGPANGAVNDYIVLELDIRTGQVLWEWHSLGHIPISASYLHRYKNTPYDAYHLNSIQQLPHHRLLVSIRSAWSVYEIDERTGQVIWHLGGKHSSFRMGPGTKFQWQHDAHLNAHGVLTVFDDADALGGKQERRQSSAKELKIDSRKHTASLVRTFRHSPPLLSGAEGSAQLLRNHDVFVGWGSEPVFSQYTASGRQIFSASFPLGVHSYRAYRSAWTGHPVNPPALAESKGKHGAVWLYASWNGATQVAAWRVLAGSAADKLKPVAVKRWENFETAIRLHTSARQFAVVALDAHHRVLGRSAVVSASTG